MLFWKINGMWHIWAKNFYMNLSAILNLSIRLLSKFFCCLNSKDRITKTSVGVTQSDCYYDGDGKSFTCIFVKLSNPVVWLSWYV